jgi:hypothetical protein
VHFHSIRGVGYKFTKNAWTGIQIDFVS